ncbi:MAG: TMEM175 family protein [Chloroflexota bacterium]
MVRDAGEKLDGRVDTARLEAFSDGVFAVAITLLALDLRAPDPTGLLDGLVHALLESWPVYLAYGLSFLTILIMWAYATRDRRLLGPDADERVVQGVTQAYRFGPLIYCVTVVLAFVSAEASLALCILLALFSALPRSVGRAGE